MSGFSTSETINRPIKLVFDRLTDLNNSKNWMPGVLEIKINPNVGIAKGTKYIETRRFKKEAEMVKEVNTGGNMTRTILFWPALVKTIHNADLAIRAADDRGYHLTGIMKVKKCMNAEKFYREITKTSTPINMSAEIKRLHKLYKKGALTQEEFEQAKNKVLNQ